MSDRDTLTEDLDNARDLFEQSVDIAECLINDGWRRTHMVTDPDTPDTYPIRTAGFDRDGEVWVSTYAGWATVTVDLAVPLADVIADFGSLTIVYIPTCPHDSRSGADGRWRCDQCGADCGPDTYLTPTEEKTDGD